MLMGERKLLSETHLAASEGQHTDTKDLRDRNTTNNATCDVDHSGPRTSITTTEAMTWCSLQCCAAGERERSRDVGGEFNADTDTDNEIDKRHGV